MRVPGLPIRDCTRGCNNCGPTWPKQSAIHVTDKPFFERLYLVLGLRKTAPFVNCPYAPTTPTIHFTTISRFLCNFFPRMAPQFFCQHNPPSNLAESRYPPHDTGVYPYVSAYVCVRVARCARVYICVCVCVRVCVRACVCVYRYA